jgi:3-hydroxyisobutyrate dehydrogenase
VSAAPKRVGIVGLGQIGGGIAAALGAGGWAVIGYDVRSADTLGLPPSVSLAASPADVAAQAEVVLLAVLDDQQVRDVLVGPEGILSTASPSSAVAVISTIGADTLAWAGQVARERDIGIADCCVTGGVAAANAGQLVAMIGGDPQTVEKVTSVAEAFSSLVVHVGGLGTGLRLKLARNLVTYGSWLAAYEAARIVSSSGIDVAQLVEVIRASDPMIGGASGLISGESSSRPPAELLAAISHKDLRATLSLAHELDLDLPGARLVEEQIDKVLGSAGNTSPTSERRTENG